MKPNEKLTESNDAASTRQKIDTFFASLSDFDLGCIFLGAVSKHFTNDENDADPLWVTQLPERIRVPYLVLDVTGFLQGDGAHQYHYYRVPHVLVPASFRKVGLEQLAFALESLWNFVSQHISGNSDAELHRRQNKQKWYRLCDDADELLSDDDADIQCRTGTYLRQHRYEYAELLEAMEAKEKFNAELNRLAGLE